MTTANPGIASLEEIVASLSAKERALFQRIYAVVTHTGEQRIPPGMNAWVKQHFGSVEAVARQRVVRVTNKITGEESLFNPLRARRPVIGMREGDLEAELRGGAADLFCCPQENTPEDTFGRVTGKYCTTASNIAKYDGLHGVVIFNDSDPLGFSREQVIDYIDTGWEWAKRAHAGQPEAKYFFFLWNCLWRAGASTNHGHAQVMLARDRHYARIERLRRDALDYRESYGSGYFADLFRVHRFVGCAVEKEGVRILAYLTPVKDNGVVLMADELALPLKERIYEVLSCLRDRLHVASFNAALVTPPLAETEESWDGFPVIVRMVDRGDLNNRTSDIGSMELYASSIISSDAFDLARRLKESLE